MPETEPDLSFQLEKIEVLLAGVESQIKTFEDRIESSGRAINDLSSILPALDQILAFTDSANIPDPNAYRTLAQSIFAPLQSKLSLVEHVLDVSFAPEAAIQGLTEEVREKLSDIDAFATDAASNFTDDVSELVELVTEGITSRLKNAVEDWIEKSEEAEDKVMSAADSFEAFCENATEAVEEELKERLIDLLGNELGEITERIDNVFEEAERALDRVEGLVSDGVAETTTAVEEVLEIQRIIRDLRPLMEILM